MSSLNCFFGHFLIVDIGHPMADNTIILIKNSLQNVLSLACNFRDVSRIPAFGYGVLSPSFQIIQQWKTLTGNFHTIDNSLEYLENPSNIGAKITLQDYRSFLENSIENIVTDFEYYSNEWKIKTEIKEQFNPLHYWPSQMQITLITRKGGSLIVEILKRFQYYSTKLQKIEIVEISSCGDKKSYISDNETNFVSYSLITETLYDLDGTFKRWILGDDTNREQLHIILNKDPEFHIKCEISDCLINPAITTLPNTLSLSAITPTFITQKPLHLPVNKRSIHEMEVVSKIATSDVCPSVLFGFPQWINPTRTCIPNRDEFRYNAEIFKSLCAQLSTAEIGLIARLKPSSPFNKINPLYFITSDGMRLLMKNIIPMELKLPQQALMTPRGVDDTGEEANDLVCSLIGQMNMEKILPQSLSIGVYEYFREQTSEVRKNDGKSFKIGCEFVPKAKRKKTSHNDISPGEYVPKFMSPPGKNFGTVKAHKSKKNIRSNKEEAIHPALMSPGTMAKYRKHTANHYELPEVMEPGVL